MKNKKLRNLIDSNHGVAGIIVALLMIGLVLSGIAFIQTAFVPMWMEQREAEHMDEVAKQFSQLKFAADSLSASATQLTSITSPVTLGSKELPFFSSSRAYGSIGIFPNDFEMEFNDGVNDYPYKLGSLKYESSNSYFVDQSYTFESGAVILAQDKGDVVFLEPNIVCNGNQITCYLTRLNNLENENTITGFGTYPIKIYFSDRLSQTINSVRSITITNSHLEAWEEYFDDLFKDNIKISYTKYPIGTTGLKIAFEEEGPSVYPDMLVYQNTINVKISLGYFN